MGGNVGATALGGLLKQEDHLELQRCPHCGVAKPSLVNRWHHSTTDHAGADHRMWRTYQCVTCGGVLLTVAAGNQLNQQVLKIYPEARSASPDLPDDALHFMTEALAAGHTPSAAIMVTASAVDAMLREKGYADGKLNSRIKKAAEDHVITADMAQWAHEVRLDANAERHADPKPRPTSDEARETLEFALALADYLFVMPARVARSRDRRGKAADS